MDLIDRIDISTNAGLRNRALMRLGFAIGLRRDAARMRRTPRLQISDTYDIRPSLARTNRRIGSSAAACPSDGGLKLDPSGYAEGEQFLRRKPRPEVKST